MTTPTERRILLAGVRGQVGFELARCLSTLGTVTAFDSTQLDLTDEESIRRRVRETAPEIIVNAAAYTAVDRAEEERELADAVNAQAPRIFAEAADSIGAAVVHYSTDYVFDGTSATPYHEDDTPSPVNWYGETKLRGEQALLDSDCPCLVLRTSWVYGLRGSNFLLTMRRLAGQRSTLEVVDDQVGSPTWCRTIAAATAQILAGQDDVVAHVGRHRGIYHLTSTGEVSWCGFARRIFALDGNEAIDVKGIETREYPTPATRPARSVLDTTRVQQVFGLRLPTWDDALALAVEA